MNKRFFTLLAGILLATTAAFAAGTAPDALKDGDVMFIKNSGKSVSATHFPTADQGTYLKLTKENGIKPVAVSKCVFDSPAAIDSASWKVSIRENANGDLDYAFVNVANSDIKLSFAAPAKGAPTNTLSGTMNYKALFENTDSATVAANETYWALNESSTGYYSIAYKVKGETEATDSAAVLGVFRTSVDFGGVKTVNDYSLRIAKMPLNNNDFKAAAQRIDGLDTQCSDYAFWTFEVEAVTAAKAAYEALVENVTYAELQNPVLTTTTIAGFDVPFMVVPVKEITEDGLVTLFANGEESSVATQFMFMPADQIGAKNPEYLSITTERYKMAGVHDKSFGSKLGKDTLAVAGDENLNKNGLKVFSILRKPSNPDSLVFRPASKVDYSTEEVVANPGTGLVAADAYAFTTKEVVIGMAEFESVKVPTTVEVDGQEGKMVPFKFKKIDAPALKNGYYFIGTTDGEFVVFDGCAADEKDTIPAYSETRSAHIWKVAIDENNLVTVSNLNSGIKLIEDQPIFDTETGYKTVSGIEFSVEEADITKVNEYFAVENEDLDYNVFSFLLVNGLGENQYVVKNAADSVISVSMAEGDLKLSAEPVTALYGEDDALTATGYKFNKGDYNLGFADGKLVYSKYVTAETFFFQNGSKEDQYYVRVAGIDGEFLNAYATDNYITSVEGDICSKLGQDQFKIEMSRTYSYKTLEPGHYNIKTVGRGDMLTKIDLAADTTYGVFRRPEADGLKAEYNEDAFKLWVDTAAYDADRTLYEPTYFIVAGVDAIESPMLEGNFLSLTDSARFIQAIRQATQDSLLIGEEVVKGDAMKAYRFKFRYADEAGEELMMINENGKSVKIVNDAIVAVDADDADAMKVTVERVTAPTDNADIDEVSGINVVAGKGTVTIQNAAGKKVAITNILGQVIATSVISSDNATISVPAGVAIISVDGEESAKAIVK